MLLQSFVVVRNFPPPEVSEDDESEAFAEESGGEASVGNKEDNAEDVGVDHHSRSVEAPKNDVLNPEIIREPQADSVLIADAAPTASAPTFSKKPSGGYIDEDSLFDE